MSEIFKKFSELKKNPSDINEHLDSLYQLASFCDTVTEFGVRTAVSTYALLSWCNNVTSYDIYELKEVKDLIEQAQREEKNFKFVLADVLNVDIEETDMLFIDTRHVWKQIKAELERHGSKVKKYMAFHDTETFGITWEDWGEGIMMQIDIFLDNNPERRIMHRHKNNNGLLIISKE